MKHPDKAVVSEIFVVYTYLSSIRYISNKTQFLVVWQTRMRRDTGAGFAIDSYSAVLARRTVKMEEYILRIVLAVIYVNREEKGWSQAPSTEQFPDYPM